jgi:anhydro-N-acetylmuramic acid kinase
MSELFIGIMSGTSADSVDTVLLSISEEEIKSLGSYSHPIPEKVKHSIYELVNSTNLDKENLKALDIDLGEIFAEAVNELLIQEGVSSKTIQAIGSHGQTIKHSPNLPVPFSLQIGNAQLLANLTGIRTVSDFRSDDISAGGQGAPITPIFNNHAFSSDNKRVIINIGGIANITLLDPTTSMVGYDTGPGNCLMDSWTRENGLGNYDEGGKWAKSGKVNPLLLAVMLEDNYFKEKNPKSTGPDFFNLKWVRKSIDKSGENLNPEDLQSTLLELTVKSLTGELKALGISEPDGLYFCGGGIHNKYLMERIEKEIGWKIYTTSDIGIDPNYLEATSFAWFSEQRIKGKKFDLSRITGSKREVFLGKITEPTI